MQYQGGKWRMRKDISNIIKLFYDEYPGCFKGYIEPFVGGGSVLSEVCSWMPRNNWEIVASDYNEDLIILWKELMSGWIPPDNVSEELYKEMMQTSDDFKSALKTFVLFHSFGRKWRGGYRRDKQGDTNTSTHQMKNRLMADIENFKLVTNVQILHKSFFEYSNIKDYILYCDPPYRNTTGYSGAKQEFDSLLFDERARELSKNNLVIISEYVCGKDFEVFFQKEQKNSLQTQKGETDTMIEKIFIHPNSMIYLENKFNTLKTVA